uniref:Thioesterase domain-containing protein n=1 Tax=Glossina brevipalpis TaxID=37001 RepID=A0A1A9X0X7_9MUSC
PTRGEISPLVIDGTGLKIFGEGEWKVRQHGADRRRWYDGYSGPTSSDKPDQRKIREALADGAYDTRYCHDALLRKKIRPLIPPRGGAQYWPDRYHERNYAVANQLLSGSNDVWKKQVGYHRRSVAETAIFRFKTLMGDHLSLRDYDAQVEDLRFVWNYELQILGSNGWARGDLTRLLELVRAGKLNPVIDNTYALTDINEAFRQLEDRLVFGKQSRFINAMQLEILEMDYEGPRLAVRMPLRPEIERGAAGSQQFHGGALAALIDVAGDFAFGMLLGSGVPTVNLNIDYLLPAVGAYVDASTIVREQGWNLCSRERITQELMMPTVFSSAKIVALAAVVIGMMSTSAYVDLTKVRYANVTDITLSQAPVIVAQELGYFKDEGLDVEVMDRRARRHPITGQRRDVGIVFQQATLLPWQTVLQNVMLPIRTLGMDIKQGEIRARALVGLEKFESHYPHELSGGCNSAWALPAA